VIASSGDNFANVAGATAANVSINATITDNASLWRVR
jgi:hypothetical protein